MSKSCPLVEVYDPERDDTPVVKICEMLGDITDQAPEDIPAIRDSIEPDALNTLYAGDRTDSYPRLTFTYAGYLIVIDCDRRIKVAELE